MWFKLYAGLLGLAVVSFAASNALLSGPDPEGWWNYLPGIVFYGTILFALVLPVGVAVSEFGAWLGRTFGSRTPNR